MDVLEAVAALSWQQSACLAAGIWLVYLAVLAVYRLWLSPLAHIPGPRLAALTHYYEFYYDVFLGGQYAFKIQDMHERYGPIVRINPGEVHVGDPDFFSEVYTEPSRKKDRWSFYSQTSSASSKRCSSVASYGSQRLRFVAPNRYSSSLAIGDMQHVIEERVNALLDALQHYADVSNGQPLDVMYPFSALTNGELLVEKISCSTGANGGHADVIKECAFAHSDHLVEKSDFGAEVTNDLLIGTHVGSFVKHVDWVLTLVNALPESISSRCMPGWSGFLRMKNDILDHINSIDRPIVSPDPYASKMLPSKLAQDGQILSQGGTLTTSWAMSLATFHLLSQPAMLRRLRDELFEAIPDPYENVPLSYLETLPYLRGVVKEALRLGIGTSSRLARVAPDETMVYYDQDCGEEYELPPGSVVGMSPYKTVMDENIFYDARGFHPERWVENGDRLDKFLSPFFTGDRVCMGMALAHPELYLMLGKLFRQWGSGGVVFGSDDDGDQREGDLGYLSIYETRVRDCEMAADYFMPIPYKGSEGFRFVFERY